MSLYSVNTLSLLKRIDLKKFASVATRAIAATSPSSLPAQPAKIPSKSSKFEPEPYPFLRELPFTPNINIEDAPRIREIFSDFPLDVFTPSENVTLKPTEKRDEAFEEKQFYLSHIENELKIPKASAEQIYFLYEHKIRDNYKKRDEFVQLCNFLKMFFTEEELRHNCVPFSIPFNELYNRVLILKELGFRSIDPSMIESNIEIFQLTSKQLREYFGHILTNQECFESMCKALEISGDEKTALVRHINSKVGGYEALTIAELRSFCIAKYLSINLKLNMNKCELSCKRSMKNLKELSLETIKRNVHLLTKDFHYSANKVVHNGLFSTLDPENLKAILTKLRVIVGENAFATLVESTQVLKTKVDLLVENYEFIKSCCGDRFHSRSIELLGKPHQKLKTIFDELNTSSDIDELNLKVFGIDFLALNRVKILNRIEHLKDEEIPFKYVPLSFFVSSEAEFAEFINDCVTNPELRVRFYLEENFDLNYNIVKHRLKQIPNVTTTRYTKQNAKKIVEFLVSMNIPRDHIIDSLYLILYDYKHVKSAYFSACARYDQTLHQDPNFFQHIFDYLVHNVSDSSK